MEALIYQPFEVSLRKLVFHPSPAVAVGWKSFLFILMALFLLAILVVMSYFTRICSGAEDWGDGAAL
jgi:hypothetical protein